MSATLTPPGTFADPEIKPTIDLYRVLVASRYMAATNLDMDKYLHEAPFLVSRKYDGELWYLVCRGKDSLLVAANGRTLTGEHPILEAAAKFENGLVLAGELHAPNSSRERVGDVAKSLATGGKGLAFGIFDIALDGAVNFEDTPSLERRSRINDFPSTTDVFPIEVSECADLAAVASTFEKLVVDAGSEGLVVRSNDGRIVKVKPQQTIDAVVVGFTEREEAGALEIRSLLLGVTGESGYVIVGVSGNFAADFSRETLYKILKPTVAPSEFKHAASTGQVYQMVRPETIVEVRCVDVQPLDSRGMPMMQPQLTFEDGQWIAHPQVAAPTLLNAVSTRIRDDKSIQDGGASWQQVERFAPPVQVREDLPESKVVRRQVWTKTSADKTDVRKLVVWKTNKDGLDASFPAFVVHWTDFSRDRKSPLDREVRPAPDESTANKLADEMIEANIKKGWVEQTT